VKVILIKDVPNLGELGEELTVKDGYARNYLIPQKVAIESTKGAVQILEQKRQEKARRDQKIKEECEELVKKIEGASFTISMEVGEEEKIFGSVTAEMIAEIMKTEGIEIDKRKIVIEEPIKALGVYNIEIKLHPEVKTEARVWVVKK